MINVYLLKIKEKNCQDISFLDESIILHCENDEVSLLSYFYLTKILINEFNFNEVKIDFTSKPKLLNSSFHFNVSHCKDYILIGLSDEEIGVDIELKNRIVSNVLKDRTLSLNEKELVKNDVDFIKCWVKKEAYLKFLGTGIDRRLNLVDSTKLNNAKLYEGEDYLFSVYSHQVTPVIVKEIYEED